MEKKSLIKHICWVLIFLTMCYGFGSLYTFMRDGFLVRRQVKYITMAMAAKPAMYLVLGAMFGVLLFLEILTLVSKRQMMIEMIIVETPILMTVLNEFGRDMLRNFGVQVSRIYNMPFRSARIIAVSYIFILYIVRRKLLQ